MNAQKNAGGLPQGELLGRYRSYEDAQKVVDHLAQSEGFDIKSISIVGNDLRSVEHIRSRLSYPRVAGAGAAQGAMFGFFIGLLIFLFAPEAPVLNLLMSVVLGMAIWMIIGVVGYAVRRGQRDFASSSQLVATTYDVVCDFQQVGRARTLVAGAGVQSLNAWNDPTGKTGPLRGAGPVRTPQGEEPAFGSGRGAGTASTAGLTGAASTSAESNGAESTGAESQPGSDSGRESNLEFGGKSRDAVQSPGRYAELSDGRPRYGARLEDYEGSHESSAAESGDAAGEQEGPVHTERSDDPRVP